MLATSAAQGGSRGAVVIGGSAGSTASLDIILPALAPDFALPIVVVVHMPKGKPNLLAPLLAQKTSLPLHEAEDKMPIANGNVYIAPPDYHLLVEPNGYLSLSTEEPVHFSRPAIDVLFESAAEVYGESLIAVLLSGASEDGASGLGAVRRKGGTTIVEDPTHAALKVMPSAAIRAGAAQHVLPLGDIAKLMNESSTRVRRQLGLNGGLSGGSSEGRPA